MLFRVDPQSPVGLADQLAGEVRGAIAAGRLAAGDRLPPAREVAAGLGINMHTVLRAYARLRDEGLVELRRGRGAQVRADVGPRRATRDLARLRQQIGELRATARHLGLTQEQLVAEIRRAT
jgi:DNA-binding transcriptional regulator YhcF (GntR family)